MSRERVIMCTLLGRDYVDGNFKFLEKEDFIELQNLIKELELDGWFVTNYSFNKWDKTHKATMRRKEHLKN